MAEVEDATVVERVLRGEREMFTVLVHRYKAAAYAVALHSLRDPRWAEEVAAEAFGHAYEGLARLRSPSKFRSWLVGLVANLCKSALRHNRRTVPLEEADPSQLARPSIDSTNTRAAMAMASLNRLPKRYRLPMLLRYVERLSSAEIGAQLGISPSAVRQRLARGTKMLQATLSEVS